MPIIVKGLDVAQLTPEHFDTAAEGRAFRLGVLNGLDTSLEILQQRALDLDVDNAGAAKAIRGAFDLVEIAASDRVALWDSRGEL